VSLSTAFAGQYVGIREIVDAVWLVSLMDYDPGFIDRDGNRVEPAGLNPFAPMGVTYVTGKHLFLLELAIGVEPTTC